MKTHRARKITEQAFNRLVEAVAAGKSEKLVAYLKAMGKFHRYSLGNILLIEGCDPSLVKLFLARFHRPLHVGLLVALSDAGSPPLEF